jgi:hypothetical protein
MPNQKGYVAGYNGRLVVTDGQVIVGAMLSRHPARPHLAAPPPGYLTGTAPDEGDAAPSPGPVTAGAVALAGRGMRRRSTIRPSRAKAAVQPSDTAAMLASTWWWKAPAAANWVEP